eukprot:7212672-Pyramimonas_sp.AAC.1
MSRRRRRCICVASPIQRDPQTPSTRTSIGVPLSKESVDERFPDVDGQERYEIIERSYGIADPSPVMAWGPDNEELLVRHSGVNARKVSAACMVYAKNILKCGVMTKFRGVMMGVQCVQKASSPDGLTSDEVTYWRMISGATLAEALYVAAKMEPDNKHVLAIRKKGVSIKKWRFDTPVDVLRWLKDRWL